ncbi:TPA: type-F conjugative transfer system secretin TraK [Escherichia coli]
MRKNNTAIIFGSLFFSCSVMAANGTLAPTVVPMVNGGQASIAISNTSPNLFTVPGDRIIAVNSLDGALTNNEQTASGGVVVATVNKKPFAVENKTLSALNIRESDFWQPGTRAVMFSQPASQLLAGARMDVYVIRDGEGN